MEATSATALRPHRDLVHRLVAACQDQPVRELRAALAEYGIELNPESIRRFLHAEGLSFKKKRVRQRTGQT